MGPIQASHCCEKDPFLRGSQATFEPTPLLSWVLVISNHNLLHLPFTITNTSLFITEFSYSHHTPNENSETYLS